MGNWYWIVDEIEAAGCVPKLVHARKAKLRMGEITKTDRLDVRGSQSTATGGHAADGVDSARRPPGPARSAAHPDGIRPTADAAQETDSRHLDRVVGELERRIQATLTPTPVIRQLLTLPGVGLTLAVVIALEEGDITRVATAEKVASYAGPPACPRERREAPIWSRARPDVNRYLKWAFVEAANAICLTRGRTSPRHISRRYERVARRKGPAKAIGAVARHLAEVATISPRPVASPRPGAAHPTAFSVAT